MQMVAHRRFASKIISMIAASAMLITGFAVVGNASAVASGGGLPIAKKLLLM